LTTLLKNKFEFVWQKNIPPSEFDRMSYWEFEEYIKMMNERNNEENERSTNEQQQQEEQQQNMMPNIPKMPNMNFNTPTLPKF